MSGYQPIGGKLFTKPFNLFALLALIGICLIAYRFIFGIGAASNLNDGYPWGIWIVMDVVVSTGFGCAGYALALTVYVMNRGEYHPLVRPAILAGLFGYTLAGMSVMVDLGRYWLFYNLLLPWYMQPNSVMFEVAICVLAYTVVVWIEFAPAFLERFGLHNVRRKLSKLLFFFIAIGILLPTMHQSSLGTMAILWGHKLSPLWQTQLLPLLFLMSAILMGSALVPFEGNFASLGFNRPPETHLYSKLSTYVFLLLGSFILIRLADLTLRSAWGYAFEQTTDALMFWIEMALYIVPFVLLFKRDNRSNRQIIFILSVCLLLAGTVYRLNTYLIGYHPGPDWNYFPSIMEILITIGMFSLEIALYLIFVKHLPVLHRAEAEAA
ncbi:MAG: Ni/Fe-hydrogenase cytochrome b subunit [Gammaproteobacteria bacterium]|nr:Ni/Fe-hydrogenase cytochrome b subunit [Gammaproteobacteria bacterium]